MTVGELKKELEKYDDKLLVQIFDDGMETDIKHIKLLIDKCEHKKGEEEHPVVMISGWHIYINTIDPHGGINYEESKV